MSVSNRESLRCPECGELLDEQEPYSEQERTMLGGGRISAPITRRFQHFICDNMGCRVSSIRVEWRNV